MRKIILIGVLALVVSSLAADDVIYLTTEQFRERVFDYKIHREWAYKGDKPCVIDFYTTWCGPCKRLAPIMAELSQTYCDQVVFYKVDTERERELAYLFGINSIPQMLYVPLRGTPQKTVGLYPKEQIVAIINEFLLAPQEEEPVPVVTEPEEPKQEQPKSLLQRWKEKIKQRKNKK